MYIAEEDKRRCCTAASLKKNLGSEKHGNYDPGLHRVSIKEHQLQGHRDPGTVFTLSYFAIVVDVVIVTVIAIVEVEQQQQQQQYWF